mgnify:FL=1
MANVLLRGTVLTGAGVAVVGATVEVFDRDDTATVRATFTGGTTAAGDWNFSYAPGANSRRVDVRVTNGTSISFLKYDDEIQVQSVETATLRIINPAFDAEYDIVPAAITAARQLNLPLITATDTFAVLGLAQTFTTGVKTFNSGLLSVRNPGDSASYIVVGDAIAANRNLNLPLLTGTGTVAVLEDVVSGGQTFAGTRIFSAGARIGADSTNNLLDDATNGAGTATLYIGNASINVTSDERVKINVRPFLGSASPLLAGLEVSQWDAYLDGYAPIGGYTGDYIGFTAQNMQKVAPWAVNTQGDTGLPWQARYEFLNGLMVKGWQEHDSRLSLLEQRVNKVVERSSNGWLKEQR